jgi:hypothetical protein
LFRWNSVRIPEPIHFLQLPVKTFNHAEQ